MARTAASSLGYQRRLEWKTKRMLMEDGQVLKEGKKIGNFEGNASGDLKAAQERLLVLQPNSLAATASPPL